MLIPEVRDGRYFVSIPESDRVTVEFDERRLCITKGNASNSFKRHEFVTLTGLWIRGLVERVMMQEHTTSREGRIWIRVENSSLPRSIGRSNSCFRMEWGGDQVILKEESTGVKWKVDLPCVRREEEE